MSSSARRREQYIACSSDDLVRSVAHLENLRSIHASTIQLQNERIERLQSRVSTLEVALFDLGWGLGWASAADISTDAGLYVGDAEAIWKLFCEIKEKMNKTTGDSPP